MRRNNCVYAILGTCYSVWMTVRYAHCRVHTGENKYQVSHKHSDFFWWCALSRPKHVEIDKYSKDKLWTKLVLFTRHEILVCCGHKNKIQSRVSNNFFLLLNKLTKLKAENLGTNYFLPMLYKLVNIGSLQNETLPHKTEILTNCTLLCGC